jgi:RNA polymerase sigma-70 factor, ECF subfamily
MHHSQSQPASQVKEAIFAELYQQHAPPIFAYLCHRVDRYEDAEDLLLEVFTAALQEEKLLQIDTTQQASWLWRVARNRVIDRFRQAKRRSVLALEEVMEQLYEDEEQEPERSALRQEEYRQLLAALAELSPLQRQILSLRFAHNLRHAEIGKILEKSEGAVRTLFTRTLERLRSIYGEYT